MMELAVFLFLQVPGQGAAPPPEIPAIQAEEPKIVCKMEPVTGSRTRKQKVCKVVGRAAPGAEAAQDMLRKMQRGGNAPLQPSG